jgi:AraC family transcriptional regulator, transcriptional activator of pobA
MDEGGDPTPAGGGPVTDAATGIAVDRLPGAGASLEVVLIEGARFGADSDAGPRRPHRHDYHELVWTRRGAGRHLIDGEVSLVEPDTITLIGRGQVHIFESARGLHGAIVRFGDELLHGDPATGVNPAWLIGSRAVPRVAVPPGEAGRLEAAVGLLAAEARRPRDSRTVDLQRHFLSALLLWVERWYEATRTEQRGADDPDLQLYRGFSEVLERDYARHHDAPHFANALGVPQAALSRALVHVTGRTTKELITDRRMLEAARLLRFSEMGVGEIAHRAGYGDQLYFSRAFKRRFGEAPSAYRERVRGRAPER